MATFAPSPALAPLALLLLLLFLLLLLLLLPLLLLFLLLVQLLLLLQASPIKEVMPGRRQREVFKIMKIRWFLRCDLLSVGLLLLLRKKTKQDP